MLLFKVQGISTDGRWNKAGFMVDLMNDVVFMEEGSDELANLSVISSLLKFMIHLVAVE